MCAHTYTAMPENTHKLGAWVGLPSLIPLPCVDFGLCLEIFFSSFPFLTFQCENFESQLRLSSCSLETCQPILNYKLFSPSWFKIHTICLRKRKERSKKKEREKQLSPLAQSVSKKASKMNSAIFRVLMLSKDNFMSPKSERHAVTVTHATHTNPWRIMLKDPEGYSVSFLKAY